MRRRSIADSAYGAAVEDAWSFRGDLVQARDC
jgi:hypothetical protein